MALSLVHHGTSSSSALKTDNLPNSRLLTNKKLSVSNAVSATMLHTGYPMGLENLKVQYLVGKMWLVSTLKMIRMEMVRMASQRRVKKRVTRREPSNMARIRTRKRKEVEAVEIIKLAPMMWRAVLQDEIVLVVKIAHVATKKMVANLDR